MMKKPDTQAFKAAFKQGSPLKKSVLLLASWFGLGLIPRVPGTVASLAGLVLVFCFNPLGPLLSGLGFLVFTVFSVCLADQAQKMLAWEDPREIVIDEVAGMWFTLLFLPFSPLNIILGFILFRIFDIIKPFPINRMEKIAGGFGIVLDDLIAGIFANLVLQITDLFIL